MNAARAERTRAIVLDIEGTTTSIAFVHDVLFPYARAHVRDYLTAHLASEEHRGTIERFRAEHAADEAAGLAPPPWTHDPPDARVAAVAGYVAWLIDRDRKSPALKDLQGRIWKRGYENGELRGHVFPDVAAALGRWRAQKIDVRIFSSGSILAQRLLFATTPGGDLTRLLNGYFDLSVGPKTSPDSYHRIAAAIAAPPAGILFISDVVGELDAARAAGMRTRLSIRPGNPPAPRDHGHPEIHSFAEVDRLATAR